MDTRETAESIPATHESVNLPCEVCGGHLSKRWRSWRYPQFGLPGAFVLRRCAGCGLVFNSPRLKPQSLARLYDRNYYVFAEPVDAAFARVAGLYRATVARLLEGAPPDRLLEVGSAKGYMLALLQDRGWAVQGVEVAGDAAGFARDALGVPTFIGALDDFAVLPGLRPFPFAFCTDVIEHVPSPRAFLAALHRVVAPRGTILIGTPNVESDGATLHGDRWLGFNPFHVWLFSRATLCRLLDHCGFDVTAAYSFGNVELGREPDVPAPKRWLRDALGRAGLLDTVRRWRAFAARSWSPQSVQELRRSTGQRLADAPPWTDDADARHPRAALCRGDNLVVLARRRPLVGESAGVPR